MQELINGHNRELDSVELVLNKLVTKQNAVVFDKLCEKVNGVLNKISSYDKSTLTNDERVSLIGVLKRMLSICKTLMNYKDYLISVVEANIRSLESSDGLNQAKVETDYTNVNDSIGVNNSLKLLPSQNKRIVNNVENIEKDAV